MAEAEEEQDLELPEQDFKYLAGTKDRPWSHFVGRWKAMKPILAEMLKECGTERPLRIVDLGSCTGFFSLQAAHRHPEADIVAVEGSVGVGNGTVGTVGSSQQILGTGAVQTHLRWIRRLGLTNCFVAPEVWDFARITELALENRPICDVMLLLSVVHHIDGISIQQYTSAGLSRLDGFINLLGKLLQLSHRHFVELPNRPWIAFAYDAYGSARSILEAAAKASGLQWRFKGPIYSVDWFGERELWVLDAATPMPQVDVQTCPFPLLYRGEEQDAAPQPEDDLIGDLGMLGPYYDIGDGLGGVLGDPPLDGGMEPLGAAGAYPYMDSGHDPAGAERLLADPEFTITPACPHIGGALMDPGLMTLTEPCSVAETRIGEALNTAPTALLLAHLALREAVNEACGLLSKLRSSGIVEEQQAAQLPAPPGYETARGSTAALPPPGVGSAAAALAVSADRWGPASVGSPGGGAAQTMVPLTQQALMAAGLH